MTRARDLLYITGQYVAYGPKDDRTYNQFLREVFEAEDIPYCPVDPNEAEGTGKEKNVPQQGGVPVRQAPMR